MATSASTVVMFLLVESSTVAPVRGVLDYLAMKDKLPIAEVRRELRMLKIELDHLMITRTIHRTYLNEELSNPRVAEVEARISYLESEYSNWEQPPRTLS